MAHSKQIRRVLTAHHGDNEDGSDVQVLDDNIPLCPVLDGTAAMGALFSSLGLPAINKPCIDNHDIHEATSRIDGVVLPSGVNGQVTDINPNVYIKMHRTSSIDYNIIISGSATLITPSQSGNGNGNGKGGEQRTVVHAGDVVIQRGTVHAWQAGEQGVRWVTVVVAALPVELNSGKVLEDIDFRGD
jgi:hypothetical protein